MSKWSQPQKYFSEIQLNYIINKNNFIFKKLKRDFKNTGKLWLCYGGGWTTRDLTHRFVVVKTSVYQMHTLGKIDSPSLWLDLVSDIISKTYKLKFNEVVLKK